MSAATDELIGRWLIEEGFNVRRLETHPPFKVVWGLDIFTQPPLNINLKIFRPEGREDRYVLLLGVAVSPEHKKKLRELSSEDVIKFSSKLMTRVISVCPTCNIGLQPSVADLQAVTVAQVIFRDEVNDRFKPRLLERVYVLINAFFMIISTFNEEFPLMPPKIKSGKEPSTII